MSAAEKTIGRVETALETAIGCVPTDKRKPDAAPRLWREIRSLATGGVAATGKQSGASQPLDAQPVGTARPLPLDDRPCPPAGRAPAARLARLLGRRPVFCQGPCLLGGSYGNLCARCGRRR